MRRWNAGCLYVSSVLAPRVVRLVALGLLLGCGAGPSATPRGAGQPDAPSGAVANARPERRVALVIGNARYVGSALPNAQNDAEDMATLLSTLGFEVAGGEAHVDLDQQELLEALRGFGRSLETTPAERTTVALFFYAGHAVQREGRNYLVPVGATVRSERDVAREMVSMEEVMRELGSSEGVRIVLLDACRNDPFASAGARGMSVGGLAPQDAPPGTVVAYSTAPGRTAADGVAAARHSPYTGALLDAMARDGLRLEDVFMEVRNRVDRWTGGAQIPWEHSSLRRPFYFRAPREESASLEARCEGGNDPGACHRLGERAEQAQRIYHALALYADGCEGEHEPSCLAFARVRTQLGIVEAPDVTRARLERSCAGDHAEGCTALGRHFELGEGRARDYPRAAEAYERGCRLGDGYGCRYLGSLYVHARGVLRDVARAMELLSEACARGVQDGCAGVGYLYAEGIGVPVDLGRAVAIYRASCALGSARACSNLGALHDEGRGVARDPALARELYERACREGNMRACTNLGWHYAEGEGVARDDERARDLYQQACAGHDANGCTNLGWFYEHGRVVAADYDRARALYEATCDEHERVGCFNLGGLYLEGRGVAADAARAAGLYERACEGGSDAACAMLGTLYFQGRGVQRDVARARTLLGSACAEGILPSCTSLGGTYVSGPAAARDYEQARAHFTRACEGGNHAGCFNLGVLYKNGLGVEPERERARALFEQACAGGHAPACAQLGR